MAGKRKDPTTVEEVDRLHSQGSGVQGGAVRCCGERRAMRTRGGGRVISAPISPNGSKIFSVIVSMQEELNLLQDEFDESVVINDDEARTLMATATLRSCEDSLLSLQKNQKRSAEFTKMGSRRIMMAKEKLKSFKEDPGENKIISEESQGINSNAAKEEDLPKKNQALVQIGSDMCLVELAEKINELVNKIISLEVTISSQNAQIENLRVETNELHKHVESLEEEKLTLIEASGSSSNILKPSEEELLNIQDVKKVSYGANADAATTSDDCYLDTTYNSEILQYSKHEETNIACISQEEKKTLSNMEPISTWLLPTSYIFSTFPL